MALKFLTLQKILLRGCDPDPKQCLTAQEVLNAKRAPTVNLGETVRARLQQFSVMNKFKRRLSERITLERAELGLHKLGHQMPDADVQILMDANPSLQKTFPLTLGFFLQDGKISYEEFAAMMKAGTDWRKASRQYSRERFTSLSLRLMKDGSLQAKKGGIV
ncbi:hypothetical protein HPP92_020879 [Vanilla planifolia]|uniref:Uncharacterized protein n=1 Tax=Vanilla planifolia TaxID=51239 RepID=A0A835Q0H9_VANPL|nr:hypothetical protein HPP92_020879 [Vanilla planifolia]